MFQKFHIVLIFFLYSTCHISCKKSNSSASSNDEYLMQLLKKNAPNQLLDYYILPLSNDLLHIPQDTANPLSFEKINLGQALFFDPAISFNPKCSAAAQTFSCATCHFAEAGFAAGIHQAIAGGGRGFGLLRHKHPLCDSFEVDVQLMATPSIINCAYQEVMLWTGKFGCCGPNFGTDSLWPKSSFIALNSLHLSGVETQARVALEAHGMRMSPALVTKTNYLKMFDTAFSTERLDLRYRRFTMAKAIAAFERTVLANEAPFQHWLRGDSFALTENQKRGAILFFGKAKCVECHTGPALNSMEFYALGMNDMQGIDIIIKDSMDDNHLGRAALTKRDEDMFCFKVPQLYNVKDMNYLAHGASFCSVEEIIRYKNEAVPQNNKVSAKYISKKFVPLHLNNDEIKRLTDFVENALYDPNLKRYTPSSVPSGLCFPNNDKLSREQLNCK